MCGDFPTTAAAVHFGISAGEPSGDDRQRFGAATDNALASACQGDADHAREPQRGTCAAARDERRLRGPAPDDSRLTARIESYELAAQLRLSAPELLDLSGESEATKKLYGLERPRTADFGKRCLLARRMIERGVRFVQVWSGQGGGGDNWDNHVSIPKELAAAAGKMDQPAAALLMDLKSRGLLADTLLVWTTEFGRMPFTQGNTLGRDHNGGTFVSWFAGGGERRRSPRTERRVVVEGGRKPHDNLRLSRDDSAPAGHRSQKLSFRHSGIDRRLTNVHGRVVNEVLA